MVDDNVLVVTEAQVVGNSRLRSNAQGDFVSLRESTQLASPEARVADALRLDTDTQGEVGSLAQTTQLLVLPNDVLNDCFEMNKTTPIMQANKFAILQSCDDNTDVIADNVQENAYEDSDDVENIFTEDPKLFYPDDSLAADLLVLDDDDDAYEESWSEGDKDTPVLAGNAQGELTTKKRRGHKTKDERAKLIAVQDYGAIDEFNQCIEENNLMEIPSVGDDFTWGGTRATGWVSKKLDRILFSPEWMDVFLKVSIELLSRTTSDHSPLLLQFDAQLESKPRSFRFQKMWLRRGDFKDLVQYNWSQPVWGSGMLAFSLKLCRLKLALKEWNKLHFGDVFQNLKLAEDKEHGTEGNKGKDFSNDGYYWSDKDSEYDSKYDNEDYEENVDDSEDIWGGEDGYTGSLASVSMGEFTHIGAGDIDESEDEVVGGRLRDVNTTVLYCDDDFEPLHKSYDEAEPALEQFDPVKDMWDPPLRCGLAFSSLEESRHGIRIWNIIRSFQWRFKKHLETKG
ncbi:OLC1v1005440C1 [Oldenlandia corymbosa var. corymbosa]|uniref:OLC1v1005440C1 n=1 Tax=Oldenlandia corymbosa var. corymbosa TaxID=529605 RepID=A0AAV1DGL7_OLDCO|nr:OLC1v1005440C1 [Oldenlandia corymbosa var. corymbosa]